jgi:hypothetical protein
MTKQRYLDLVGFSSPQQAYKRIKEWVSSLSDDEHLIRSTIFDIHAGIELELRQIMYHYLKALVFQTDDEKENEAAMKPFEKMIERLSFGDMYRILKPILESWAYPDLQSIGPINELRNQVAHRAAVDEIRYKGRNPFRDADAFAQVFFEAWAVRQKLTKFFERAIEDPRALCKRYYQQYEKCLREHSEAEK